MRVGSTCFRRTPYVPANATAAPVEVGKDEAFVDDTSFPSPALIVNIELKNGSRVVEYKRALAVDQCELL